MVLKNTGCRWTSVHERRSASAAECRDEATKELVKTKAALEVEVTSLRAFQKETRAKEERDEAAK